MSLILEALRKSEAERRRGETPDLRMELQPAATHGPRARRQFAWVAPGVVLAVALLAALWWQDRDDASADATTASTDPAAAAVTSPPGPAAAGEKDDPGTDDFPIVDRILPPAPVRRAPTVPPPVVPDRQLPTAPADETPSPPLAALPPTPVPDAASPDHAATRITGLSSDQRQRLPAMKLSLHMWNDDPTRRFVVVDGQRKAEGDRVGDALITAIDRDGILLDLDGQAVRVPLP